jgi:elongation factor Ts
VCVTEHGAAKASSKVAGRETVEGLVGLATSEDAKSLAVVQVASETDFAGRSDTFVQLVQDVTTSVLAQEAVSNSPLSTEQLHGLPGKGDSGATSVKDLMDNAIVAIRENLSIASATKYVSSDPQSIWVPYVHNKVPGTETGTAVSAVLVGPSSDSTVDPQTLRTIGKRLAMHIVAAKPLYLSKEDVPDDALEKERSVLQGQIELDNNAGKTKPPEIVEKMIQGRLRKYFEQICLTEQAHMIEEGNPKVSKVLQGKGVDVHEFVYLAVGSA